MKIMTARPKVASYLMKRGYEPEIIRNPYAPCRVAWEFEYSDGLIFAMRDCYKEIGAVLPDYIQEYLNRIDPNASRSKKKPR